MKMTRLMNSFFGAQRLMVCCLACALLWGMTTAFGASGSKADEIKLRPTSDGRHILNFNRDWKFSRGGQPGVEAPGFDDSAWETVRLPHDWAILGPVMPSGDGGTGKLPWRGEGWYRKTFVLPASGMGKRVYLQFDGVMANPIVYVNGQKAGNWDYGYTSFQVDATDFVKFGQPNVVAVYVDTRTHNSRWYPGAGIYRKVQLVLTEPIHVAHWGLAVTTPIITPKYSRIEAVAAIENHNSQDIVVDVVMSLYSPLGNLKRTARSTRKIPAKDSLECVEWIGEPDPKLWDVESPNLYKLVAQVWMGGRMLDSYETSFGIRSFQFTADKGFFLNGRRVQLKGVDLHHDHGPLGAKFLPRAMERQLEIMRDMGVNALRTSHNPPAPEVLDLCDRMGIVVIDEAFDKWDATSTRPPGISITEHGDKQIRNLVFRDRNHPCVVAWSIGNEISDLESGKVADGKELVRQMVAIVKKYDTNRPVTYVHHIPKALEVGIDDALDLSSWNYGRKYALSHQKNPGRPVLYSESASALSTRGYYAFPHPAAKDDFPDTMQLSSYDHHAANWSDIADVEFMRMETDTFCAGEFVWTGFDYLGEPTPYDVFGYKKRRLQPAEESRSSYFGIVDLVGIPKDRYYLYRSHWAPEKNTIHILPHWDWPNRIGQNVPVYVYTSGDSAELFLNGKSLGKRTKEPKSQNPMDRYRLRWEDVVYQPGQLKAVAYQGGKMLGEASVKTAGDPMAIRLTPDRTRIKADGDDLCYVLVEVVDKDGNVCPLAKDEITFKVNKYASIAGVGNGNPQSKEEFVSNEVSLFGGKAMVILRSVEGGGGHIRLTATGKLYPRTELTVQSN